MNMHIAGIRLPTPDEIDREFVQKSLLHNPSKSPDIAKLQIP